ncbi:MAG TPA: PEGA domain-containing protein, partial [Anaeromyxobacter sp.]
MIRRTAATLAVLALLAAPPPARGDDVAEAKARFRKGAELYRAGKWREAIAEFEAAYRLKPAGAIHFNVAQCREKLSEWPGALRAYHDYLREVPDAKDRAAVRASIERNERRLAAAGVQALLVYSDPPGAAVVLDGRSRGTTPFHIVLPPGSYALALSLDGYEPVKQDVSLPPAASRAVDVVLRPAAPAPSPPAAA